MQTPSSPAFRESCTETHETRKHRKTGGTRRLVAGCTAALALLIVGCMTLLNGQFNALLPTKPSESAAGYELGSTEHAVALSESRQLQTNNGAPRVDILLAQASLNKDMTPVWEKEKELGMKFDGVMVFEILWDFNYQKQIVEPFLNRGYKVILCLEFVDKFPNLMEIGNGRYDTFLWPIAKAMAKDKRRIGLRFLHEFNGGWYDWGTQAGGSNSPEAFKRAWIHLVKLFRKANAPVFFQLNYNNKNGEDDKSPFSKWYPGDQWVDEVSISGYNRAGIGGARWISFKDVIGPAYWQLKKLTNKPINVGETGCPTAPELGDKPKWLRDAFNNMIYDFDRMNEVTFFFVEKEASWDLNTKKEIDAFTQGVSKMRRLTQGEKYVPGE